MALSPKFRARHARSPFTTISLNNDSHISTSSSISRRSRQRRIFARLIIQVILSIALVWTVLEVILVRRALVHPPSPSTYTLGQENVLLVGIHWNNARILHSHWNAAVLATARAIQAGGGHAHVSVLESGSWDGTQDVLRDLQGQLIAARIPHTVIIDPTTHADEIARTPPAGESEEWITTPSGTTELRRIPYLSRLRNLSLAPLRNSTANGGVRFDKILFLNDVVFTPADVSRLLGTNDGSYAAACALDFDKPPAFYDTFALRDAEGANKLKKTWPFFRAAESRRAVKANRPVPVQSCWNGIVAMDAAPFYSLSAASSSSNKERNDGLKFRGIPTSLAASHLEASECCLIHADNPLSATKGVFVNTAVRVGYKPEAYDAVNPDDGRPWVGAWQIVAGAWRNRILRWTSSPWWKDRVVRSRIAAWEKREGQEEKGAMCVVDEMQVLVYNGWKHL